MWLGNRKRESMRTGKVIVAIHERRRLNPRQLVHHQRGMARADVNYDLGRLDNKERAMFTFDWQLDARRHGELETNDRCEGAKAFYK